LKLKRRDYSVFAIYQHPAFKASPKARIERISAA